MLATLWEAQDEIKSAARAAQGDNTEGFQLYKQRIAISREQSATLGNGMGSFGDCLDYVRPVVVCLDRSTKACTDPVALREGALERYGDLHVRTGTKFIFQWHSKYFSQVLPFVIPRMVSGPDYKI